jgi:hypothetical protein
MPMHELRATTKLKIQPPGDPMPIQNLKNVGIE